LTFSMAKLNYFIATLIEVSEIRVFREICSYLLRIFNSLPIFTIIIFVKRMTRT